MEQTLQKRKPFHQPVGNLHVGFESIKLLDGKYVILLWDAVFWESGHKLIYTLQVSIDFVSIKKNKGEEECSCLWFSKM